MSSTLWVAARFQSPSRRWRLPHLLWPSDFAFRATPRQAADFLGPPSPQGDGGCPITRYVTIPIAAKRPHIGQISSDKNVIFLHTGKRPAGDSERSILGRHWRLPYLPNPGLRHVACLCMSHADKSAHGFGVFAYLHSSFPA